jgi:hypothetical protein
VITRPRAAAIVTAAVVAVSLAPVSSADAAKRFQTQITIWESHLQACKVANDDRTGFRVFIRVDNRDSKLEDKAKGGIYVLRNGKRTKQHFKTKWAPGGTISNVGHVFAKNTPDRTLELFITREHGGSGNIIPISDVRNC